MIMADTKKLTKLILKTGPDRGVYELCGGGSITPGVPIPEDTVDSRSIVNDTIEMEDLNQSVKDKMVTDADRVTAEELAKFNV